MTGKQAPVATALGAILLVCTLDASAQTVAAGANAAQLDAARSILTLKSADVDLSVPDSPAFIALGLSPETVVRPTSPREFATSLLNGVGQDGHLQTGVAVDVVPYLVY